MPTLEEQLSDDQREQLARNRLVKGAIVRMFCNDLAHTNKVKRFIIVGLSADGREVARLHFNSKCPPLPYQVPFEPHGRPYLDRTSYLDCGEIYESSYVHVLGELKQKPGSYVGFMSAADMEVIEMQVALSKTIPLNVKIKYGYPDFSNSENP